MAFSKSRYLLLIIAVLTKYSNQICETNILREGRNCRIYGYRDCYESTFSLTCRNEYINTIIANREHSQIEQLMIINCTSSKISVGALHNFENLVHLDVINGNVEELELGAFSGMSSLQNLTLTNNKISKLSKGVFNSLLKLNRLNLERNSIEEIENNTFFGLKNLHSLSLDHNNISNKLSKDTFDSLTQLNTLSLSNNFIQEIENDAFLVMRNLAFLSLNHNNISNIAEILNHCDNLKTLDLSYNQVENIFFNNFKSLTVLTLNNNKIVEITNGSLVNTSIRRLDLSSNLINDMNDETFQNMKSLTYLNLALNKMSDLDDGRLPVQLFRDNTFLEHLNLSRISLNGISVGTFTGLVHLKVLDLSHNNIRFLAKSIFHDLTSSFTELYINDNSIAYFEYDELPKKISLLFTIDLNDNPWHCDTLSTLVHKIRSDLIIRGSSFNTTNILGIACSEIQQVNEVLNSLGTNKSVIELEKYSEIYLNSLIEEYHDFLGEIKNDFKIFFNEFSKAFLNIFKTTCINHSNTNCAPRHDEASEVNLKLIQSALERINSEDDVLKEVSKKFNEPQRLQGTFNQNEKANVDCSPNIVLVCILLVLILILLSLISGLYLILKLLKENKKMQLPLLESVNL